MLFKCKERKEAGLYVFTHPATHCRLYGHTAAVQASRTLETHRKCFIWSQTLDQSKADNTWIKTSALVSRTTSGLAPPLGFKPQSLWSFTLFII